jgi:HD-GYP domain-containing protein (c-di-GMP phosphodiesterase class II)
MVKELIDSQFRYVSLMYPKSENDEFYQHAVNTAVIALVLGKRYRFPANELYLLGLGSLLHDIGKVVVDRLMDSRDGDALPEFYREHPTFGYLLLKNDRLLSPLVLQVINQHHEQQDGKGFPLGLVGTNNPPLRDGSVPRPGIFRFAEICAVANAYDRLLLSPLEDGSGRYTPLDTIKAITAAAGKVYNKAIVEKLCDTIPIYPVGSYVRILDIADSSLIGCSGVVAKTNETNLEQPTLIVTTNKYQKKIKPILIDTAKLSRVELKMVL